MKSIEQKNQLRLLCISWHLSQSRYFTETCTAFKLTMTKLKTDMQNTKNNCGSFNYVFFPLQLK